MSTWFSNLADTLPVWTTLRAAGLTSYMLLFAAMVAGLLQGETWATGTKKATLNLIHQWCGWFGMLFGLVHGLVLVFDEPAGYSFMDIVIPFAAENEPVWSGLGTIAFYLMVLLILSSDLIKTIGKKVWRVLHFMALPTFTLALLHAIMLGTDSGTPAMKLMYLITGAAVAALIVRRIYMAVSKSDGKEISISVIQPDKKINSYRP